MKLILCLLLAFVAAAFAKVKDDSKSNWDKLDEMLEKERMLKKGIADFEDDDLDEDDEDKPNAANVEVVEKEVPPHLAENPCTTHHCPWGKECVVNKAGKPRCECIKECPHVENPNAFDKACSNQNDTFDSICDLYRERCLCKKGSSECKNQRHAKAHLGYLGKCKELESCTEEMMEQFPQRMSDWLFQVMKDMNDRDALEDTWIHMLHESEQTDDVRHVYPVIWKFCDLDVKPHDKKVSHHELIPITAPVIPMESCIKPFLNKCDENSDGKITLHEWGQCLGLTKGQIVEKC